MIEPETLLQKVLKSEVGDNGWRATEWIKHFTFDPVITTTATAANGEGDDLVTTATTVSVCSAVNSSDQADMSSALERWAKRIDSYYSTLYDEIIGKKWVWR